MSKYDCIPSRSAARVWMDQILPRVPSEQAWKAYQETNDHCRGEVTDAAQHFATPVTAEAVAAVADQGSNAAAGPAVSEAASPVEPCSYIASKVYGQVRPASQPIRHHAAPGIP